MATVLSFTEIQVNWTEVPERDQNGMVTVYEVMYEQLTMTEVFNANTSNFTVILGELVPAQMYNISVRAYTDAGPGPFSTPELTVETDETSMFFLYVDCIDLIKIMPAL